LRLRGIKYALVLTIATLSSIGITGCGDDDRALLLTITAESRVDSFTLRVLTEQNKTLYETINEPVDQDHPLRDISDPTEALRLVLHFDEPGTYVIHLAGFSSGPVQVWTKRVTVTDGIHKISVHLTPLWGADADRDTYVSQDDCNALSGAGLVCDVVDCDDTNSAIYPGAPERCNNAIDEDCDGEDLPCEDADGDGFTSDLDCDDENPDRFPGNPEAINICSGIDPPRCNDGVDQDCDGEDAICVVDLDCDESSPPYDCNDQDITINPNAPELCGNNVDDNCDGDVDEGCVPCDLDGDGYERVDPAADCNPPASEIDCDDVDSGISPGVTADCGGDEGAPACAARSMCDGKDNDCDGLVDEGCPDPTCDNDRDGFLRDDPANGCNPPLGQADCSDADASFYPGAPDVCGDGLLQNCNTDTPCSADLDGDGYNSMDGDCDDDASAIHPGAVEICDGLDNDCDGLVDEGNPDGLTGAPIPTNAFCTLSNIGHCGDPAGGGRCICSRQLPPVITTGSNRTDCTNYGLDVTASAPRCFFAPVPTMERCDATDWNCDGAPDSPTGDPPLVELGQPCGTDVGRCEPGQVVASPPSAPRISTSSARISREPKPPSCATGSTTTATESCPQTRWTPTLMATWPARGAYRANWMWGSWDATTAVQTTPAATRERRSSAMTWTTTAMTTPPTTAPMTAELVPVARGMVAPTSRWTPTTAAPVVPPATGTKSRTASTAPAAAAPDPHVSPGRCAPTTAAAATWTGPAAGAAGTTAA